jgi:hypothetical protein
VCVTDSVLLQNMVPRITPSNLQVTPRGRVKLAFSDTGSEEQCDEFVAPEYRPGVQVACDSSLEKVGSSLCSGNSTVSLQFLNLLYNDTANIETARIHEHIFMP